MKTFKMLLYLTSVSLCLVFFLVAATGISSTNQESFAWENILRWIEPASFLISCICISITPIRVLPKRIRKTSAVLSTLLITLYYLSVTFMGGGLINQTNSVIFQMDAWVIILLLLLGTYTLMMFRADPPDASALGQEDDLLIDPLLYIPQKPATQTSQEEIELEITSVSLGHSTKRWRQTT